MTNCYLHKPCFFNWSILSLDKQEANDFTKQASFWRRHHIEEHVANEEITDFNDEVVGPLTAIARVHTLRKQGKYKEADEYKDRYLIQVVPGGYLALRRNW